MLPRPRHADSDSFRCIDQNSLADALERQARSCSDLGSPMYGRILLWMLDDYLAGGITTSLLSGHEERAVPDAIPLRLLGAIHLAVLKGTLPALARHYPSVGGAPRPGLLDDFRSALVDAAPMVREGLLRQVQTNEVGRSVVPMALLNWLGHLGETEVDWLEVGASAGLNLCFDSYSADTGRGHWGAPQSNVHFDRGWFDVPPPHCPAQVRIHRRVASDLHPLNVSDDEQALRVMSFVWPDQTDRYTRTREAIAIARRTGVRVGRASAEVAARAFLREPPERTRVIYHSIVWQYLPIAVREALLEEIRTAGRSSSPGSRLVWARMEPSGDVADIRVDVWSGGDGPEALRLATVGYHGRGLHWF